MIRKKQLISHCSTNGILLSFSGKCTPFLFQNPHLKQFSAPNTAAMVTESELTQSRFLRTRGRTGEWRHGLKTHLSLRSRLFSRSRSLSRFLCSRSRFLSSSLLPNSLSSSLCTWPGLSLPGLPRPPGKLSRKPGVKPRPMPGSQGMPGGGPIMGGNGWLGSGTKPEIYRLGLQWYSFPQQDVHPIQDTVCTI